MTKIPEKINIQEVVDYVGTLSDMTRIYIGTDSEKFRKAGKWYAKHISVVVVRIDGNRGCRIFGEMNIEPDYDRNKGKPNLRLMTEVRKSAELYIKVFDAFQDRPEIALNMEIHLDVNNKVGTGSSYVVDEAVGYIRGVCGIEPQIKPDAWSASYAADRFEEIHQITEAHRRERLEAA